MAISFSDALAQITGPGGRFELTTAIVDGQEHTVFATGPRTLRDVFDTLRTREGLFLVYEDERRTFAEVVAEIDALGHTLVHTYDVRPGDRVAIAMRNLPEWITAFAAVVSVGAIAVCINAWWTTDELRYGLDDAGVKVLIADPERVERVAPLVAGGTGDRPVQGPLDVIAVRMPTGAELPPHTRRWEDVVVPGEAMPDVTVDPESDATILFTSGTTGHPKGAVSVHRAVVSALQSYACRGVVAAIMKRSAAEEAGAAGGSGDRNPERPPGPRVRASYILVVPLFHVTGLVPVMLGAVLGGNKLVMLHKWNPERALELIEREQITTFVGVPTMSFDLLESPDFATRDTSSLVSVGGGGAPTPPGLVSRIDTSFAKGRPSIGYGMTETNGYGPQNMGDDYVAKPQSSGRTITTMQVRVVDPETGVPLPAGEESIGEIEFRGPNLIRGYWNRPEATAEAFHEGWLRTGDLGYLDDDGFIFVVDRAKDMVLRGGENIYCAEVEAVIHDHPAVAEVAVFGLPHERLGEELVTAVVLRQGETLTAADLQAFVGERLASFKVPAEVHFHEGALPRGATGKIKRDLRDALLPPPANPD